MKDHWIIRTYAGFGTARETNARFRENLARGQRGLSIAFDLPTQNGYDPDEPMSVGEVGVAGVSIAHRGDMAVLLEGISLGDINTSMTINATAPWLMALYLSLAEQHGVAWPALRGTTQNDLLKEFVALGTYVFDPDTSLRLATDLIIFAARHVPQWNPINCCGYHYMESGAGPVEEIGYALGNACLILDAVRPQLAAEEFAAVVRRISFFINSGIELVPEIAKVRAYFRLWPALCRDVYGIDAVHFRAGCQVRSLGLTAQQPEVNIVRIALEALPVICQASARVGALQLPGFREALQLPDVAEQTLSLRTQQVLMHETQLAAFDDIFTGSHVIERETERTMAAARVVALQMRAMGYAAAIAHIGTALGEAMIVRQQQIASGELPVVGVNCFQDESLFEVRGSKFEVQQHTSNIEPGTSDNIQSWRDQRDQGAWEAAMNEVQAAMRSGDNIMPASIALAKASGTTGEWTEAIASVSGGRFVFPVTVPSSTVSSCVTDPHFDDAVRCTTSAGRMRILLAKVGLDGHINAIKVLAHACRKAGMEVIFLGARQTPESVVAAVIAEDVQIIGISSLAGNHRYVAEQILQRLRARGVTDCHLVIGGIIPPEDIAALKSMGVAEVFTPRDTNTGLIVQRLRKLVG